MPANTKYAGRPGPYGNPYRIGDSYRSPFTGDPFFITRENCLVAFETYAKGMLAMNPQWLEPLRGFDLACWCSLDEPCHVDIILMLLYHMTPEIQEAYRVTRRFIGEPALDGHCLEASVAMAEHLRRHRTKEVDRQRVKLVRRELADGGHWSVEVDDIEYDPTCSDWSDAPIDAEPGTLYTVSVNSPHHGWPRTRIHLRSAYESVGIERRVRRRNPRRTQRAGASGSR